MTSEAEINKLIEQIRYRERAIARLDVIKEIQAFAGDYSHSVTKDGATRDVVIIEQLLDFLKASE
jgi:hypothetical protein